MLSLCAPMFCHCPLYAGNLCISMRDASPKTVRIKAPLCKGSWHGEAVTEGLYTFCYRYNPSVKTFGFDTSLYTRVLWR